MLFLQTALLWYAKTRGRALINPTYKLLKFCGWSRAWRVGHLYVWEQKVNNTKELLPLQSWRHQSSRGLKERFSKVSWWFNWKDILQPQSNPISLNTTWMLAWDVLHLILHSKPEDFLNKWDFIHHPNLAYLYSKQVITDQTWSPLFPVDSYVHYS